MGFSNTEKNKAEMILKQLEGMSIWSAKNLLNKCEKALLQNRIGTATPHQINENDHSLGSSSAPKSSEIMNFVISQREKEKVKEIIKIMKETQDTVLSAQKWAVASLLCSGTALVISVIAITLKL